MRPARLLEPFYRRYEPIAVRIGVAGNALFVLGSVLFLIGPNLPATLCWMVGSAGMFVRALGRLYVDERLAAERTPTHAMGRARAELETAPE